MLINKLRKAHGNADVAKLATSILVTWKKLLVEPEEKKATSIAAQPKKEEEVPRSHTPPGGIVSLAGRELFQAVKTEDATRDKCIEMLVTALCTDTPERIKCDLLPLSQSLHSAGESG